MVVLLVAPVLAALPQWGPPLRHHLQTLSWQRRCMNESPDAREVAYEEDPAAAAALVAADPQYVALRSAGSPVVRFSRNWEQFYALMSPPGRRPGATLFLHARRAPGGPARLVAVDATFPDPAGRASVSLNTTVIEPGSLVSRPRVVGTGGTTLSPGAGAKLRFFSGRPDPNDPPTSHSLRSRRPTRRRSTAGSATTPSGWKSRWPREPLRPVMSPASQPLTPSAPASRVHFTQRLHRRRRPRLPEPRIESASWSPRAIIPATRPKA
jgi:hypothetical protein